MKQKTLLILLSLCCAYLLNGCLPVVVVGAAAAGATAGGAMVYDQRSFKTMVADQKAESTAQYYIDHDSQLNGKVNIRVAVYNRVALLIGEAPSNDLSARANQIASSVKDIDRVYNQITIEGSTSMLEKSNDEWLMSKVKTAMVAEKGLRSNQVRVVVEQSVVYLMGLVTPAQGDLAANVARHVRGVRQVVKVFEYLS